MLRFVDGFDYYGDSGIARKWTTLVGTLSTTYYIEAGTGRNGGACYRIGNAGATIPNTFAKTLDAQGTWVVGFAYQNKLASGASIIIFGLLDAGSVQVDLRLNADNTLTLTRNGTTLATSVNAISNDIWYYIEVKCVLSNTGSYEVRVNGTSSGWISGTGDTTATANSTANQVRFGHPTANGVNKIQLYDDIYICDGTGSVNNDFLGDVMVTVIRPNGAGTTTQWTPSAGSNYACVDEASVNDDTDYVSTGAAGNIDTYAMENLSYSPSSIKGVAWNVQLRKDDASTYDVRRVVRHSGTDYAGTTAFSPNTTYANYQDIMETNPGTSTAWTKSDIDALEAGVKLNAVT